MTMSNSKAIARKFRRRASRRGFAGVTANALEMVLIASWFAALMAGAKYLDSTITQRRAAENSVQDSIHASASPCQSLPINFNLGSAGATSSVDLANIDTLGPDSMMQCPAASVGVPNQQAFQAQGTPLRHTTSSATSSRLQAEDQPGGGVTETVKNVAAQRQLSCQDIPRAIPDPAVFIKQQSQQIWGSHIAGY